MPSTQQEGSTTIMRPPTTGFGVVQNYVIRTKNKVMFTSALRLWFHKVLAELTLFDDPKLEEERKKNIESLLRDIGTLLVAIAAENKITLVPGSVKRLRVFTGSGTASIGFNAINAAQESLEYEVNLDNMAWLTK